MANLFETARLAMEDGEENNAPVSAAEVEATPEQVEQDADIQEAQELTSEIEQTDEVISQAEGELEAIDETVAQNEEVLENADSVDDAAVEQQVDATMECFNDAVVLLAGKAAKKQIVPSLESLETNISKLRISNEGLKDFASNVWEKIKELFAKFITMLRKLAVKIGAMFDKGAKRADAFIKLFKERTVKTEEISDEIKERILKSSPMFFLLKNPGQVKEAFTGTANVSTSILTDIENVAKNGVIAKGQANSKAVELVKSTDEEADLEDDEVLAFAFIRRSSVTYMGSQGSKGTIKIEPKDASEFPTAFNGIAASDCVELSTSVKDAAKKYKSFSDNALKGLNKAVDVINKMKEADLKGAATYGDKVEARKNANLVYKYSTFVTFQSIGSYSDMLSASLALLAAISPLFKRAGK